MVFPGRQILEGLLPKEALIAAKCSSLPLALSSHGTVFPSSN